MQKGIHPENYRLVAFKDMSNEEVFLTKSTADTKETLEVDGVEYPLVKLKFQEHLTHFILVKLNSWIRQDVLISLRTSTRNLPNLKLKRLKKRNKIHLNI